MPANQYINEFIICSRKLEERDEGSTVSTKKNKFLEQILDSDYDVVVQQLRGDDDANFESCVKRIRKWEQDLLRKRTETIGKARRVDFQSGEQNTEGKHIPSIPSFILHKIEPPSVRKDLIKWRGIYNNEGRQIRPDETSCATAKSRRNDVDSDGSTAPPPAKKGKQNQKQKRRVRRALQSPSGLPAASPRVRFKDDDEKENSDSGDDGDVVTNSECAKSDTKQGKKSNTAKSCRRNPIVRRLTDEPRIVLDPGTEFNIIGGQGWKVMEQISASVAIYGALSGMEGPSLPVVNAVCAHDC
jgi:hypothetical protein